MAPPRGISSAAEGSFCASDLVVDALSTNLSLSSLDTDSRKRNEADVSFLGNDAIDCCEANALPVANLAAERVNKSQATALVLEIFILCCNAGKSCPSCESPLMRDKLPRVHPKSSFGSGFHQSDRRFSSAHVSRNGEKRGHMSHGTQ